MARVKENCERRYCKDVSFYNRNNQIYSDEPYEFRIISGTPDGEIVLPNKKIRIPCHIKKIGIDKKSVTIKDSKVISIEEVEKNNTKFIKMKIIYRVSFNIRLYDKYNNINKIRCFLDKYPTPGRQSYIKEFIRVYSILRNNLCIKYNCKLAKERNYEPKVLLLSKACIKNVKCKLCKEKKFISFYNVNWESYIELLVGIIIKRCMRVSLERNFNLF